MKKKLGRTGGQNVNKKTLKKRKQRQQAADGEGGLHCHDYTGIADGWD